MARPEDSRLDRRPLRVARRLRKGLWVFGAVALLLTATGSGWCAFDGAAKVAAKVAEAPVVYPDTLFENFDQKSGLPGPVVVQAISEDGQGFLWMGTEGGVLRWDGYRFRGYAMQEGVAGALPENNIFTLYKDPLQRLWIGTKSRGIARYDPMLDRFETFVPPGKEKTYKAIYAIASDGARGLWLGTRGGLDHFDPDTGVFAHTALGSPEVHAAVEVVLREADGRVWVGTTKGLFRSDARGAHFAIVPVLGDAVLRVWSLIRDSAGRLWIGTTTKGAYVLDPGAETARPVGGDAALTGQGVDTMAEVAPGEVWLGTYGFGIVSVNTKTWETHRIVHDPAFSTSLRNDTVVALYRDAAGAVWVATEWGISRSDAAQAGVSTYFGGPSGLGASGSGDAGRIADSDLTAVLPTRDGRVWLGFNDKGVESFDTTGTKLSEPRLIAAGPKSPLPAGAMSGMAAAPDGTVFVGTQQWVYRMDSDGRHVSQLPFVHAASTSIHALVYDAGSLWIGSEGLNDGGLWKQDVSGVGGRNAPQPVFVPLTHIQITGLARGVGNDLWVGTATDLFRYDVVTQAVERIAVDPGNPNALPAAVTSLLVDRAGRLWVTTFGGGVVVMEGRDSKGQPKLRRFMKELQDGSANKVMQAADGDLWVSMDNGFAVIDPKTFAVRQVRQPDGVGIAGYWVDSGGVSVDGQLIFGGAGGLTIVRPELVKRWTYVPPVAVTDVSVGGKPVASARFNEANGGPLEIRHDANSLAVEFAALDYSAPEQNLYKYRLVGFDKDWVTTDATRRTASYTNLAPGRYTLELRGSNRDGIWGKTQEVAIRVVPAWYQTVWAKAAALLLFLLALAAAFRASTAYLRMRQRVLERKVAERTAELEAMTVELEKSRQMLEEIAYSDSLTGLPNRRMFHDCLHRLIGLKRREKGSFVLIVFDLDKFKEINDEHGHDAGDAWLKEVARRLSPIVRQSDCFARLGGDEFAILLAEGIGDEGIRHVCETVAASVTEPLIFEGIVLKTTFSLGVAVYPEDGESQDALYKSADLALYRVKREGGNGWKRYRPPVEMTEV